LQKPLDDALGKIIVKLVQENNENFNSKFHRQEFYS
jgi:hypothetical protein